MEGPTYVKDINYDIAKIQKQLATGEEASVEQQALTENDFRFTTRDGFLYVIAMGWPQNGEWKIRTLKSGTENIRSISLLGYPKALSFSQTEEALLVSAPKERPCSHAYVLKLTLQ